MPEQHSIRLGLLGHPVSHSKSPEIFNRFFAESGLTRCRYELFDLNDIADFPSFIRTELDRDLPLRGFNVTVPHKVDIIPYLDQLSAEARAVGAVNTVLVVGSKDQYQLQGHNTDVIGFSQSLLKAQSALQNPISNAVIFGNGGSAQAVKYALQNQNIPFHIWHRNRWINEAHESQDPEKYIKANTLFVHTTPLGMWPNTETAIEWPANLIAPTHRLIDLVYNPSETVLMKRFSNQGAWVMNGAYMLEQQAVAAWMLFSSNNQP